MKIKKKKMYEKFIVLDGLYQTDQWPLRFKLLANTKYQSR